MTSRRFLGWVLLWLLVGVTTSQSQGAPTLSNLELALWPEYDRPAVLVIYQGDLTGTALPIPVEIRIPARVGLPTALAYLDEMGQRYNQAYTTRQEGDWTVVSFSLETTRFQLEYYDTLPVDSTGKRSYTFDYVADYPIAAFTFKVQVPPTAQGFVLDPAASSAAPEMGGLVYHSVRIDAVAQGDSKSWTVSYHKDNNSLTNPPVEPTVAPAIVTPAGGATGDSTALLVVVGLASLAAVGVGAFWLGRSTQVRPAPVPVTRQSGKRHATGSRKSPGPASTPRSRPPVQAADPGVLYCYRCGTQMRSDAQFCHKCGAPVRDKDE